MSHSLFRAYGRLMHRGVDIFSSSAVRPPRSPAGAGSSVSQRDIQQLGDDKPCRVHRSKNPIFARTKARQQSLFVTANRLTGPRSNTQSARDCWTSTTNQRLNKETADKNHAFKLDELNTDENRKDLFCRCAINFTLRSWLWKYVQCLFMYHYGNITTNIK